jgi:hypothetical protein
MLWALDHGPRGFRFRMAFPSILGVDRVLGSAKSQGALNLSFREARAPTLAGSQRHREAIESHFTA